MDYQFFRINFSSSISGIQKVVNKKKSSKSLCYFLSMATFLSLSILSCIAEAQSQHLNESVERTIKKLEAEQVA